MRILHIMSQRQLTGAEVYALTLAEWAQKNGHEVHVVADELHMPASVPFVAMSIDNSKTWNRIKNILAVRALLKKHKIEIIHTHSRAAIRVAYWARKGLPVAMISTIHGQQHYSFSKRLWDQFGDRIVGVCENALWALKHKFNMDPRKMLVLGNAIHHEGFSEELQPHRIAWVGRFTGPKGDRLGDLCTHVFPSLLKNNPQLNIDLIGGKISFLNSTGQQAFEKLKSEFGERVQVLEKVERAKDTFHNYSVIIGAGRVAIEALMQGIPCVALGEISFLGLSTPRNYAEFKKSNFGDMGTCYESEEFQPDFALKEIEKALRQPLTLDERRKLNQLAHQDFDVEVICKEMLETYRSTLFQKLFPSPIPVLMYHKVPDQELNEKHKIYVTKQNFENHLKFFKKKGFQTLHFSELDQFRKGQKPLNEFPKKPLMLTFDDGYLDNATNALPLLKDAGFKATLFVLGDEKVRENYWDVKDGEPSHPIMSVEEQKQLPEDIIEIGSHGLRHEPLTEKPADLALQELSESKNILEQRFNRPITTFAFAYGLTNPNLALLAKKAGYRFAVNTDSGGFHIEENPYAIYRINVFPHDDEVSLAKKTSPWYRKYVHHKRRFKAKIKVALLNPTVSIFRDLLGVCTLVISE